MAPKVCSVVLLNRCPEKEILELGEGEECWCREDVYAEHMQACMVEEEWVLEGEEREGVGVHGPRVFNNVDVFRWPASSYP